MIHATVLENVDRWETLAAPTRISQPRAIIAGKYLNETRRYVSSSTNRQARLVVWVIEFGQLRVAVRGRFSGGVSENSRVSGTRRDPPHET